ncbi:MAG TPA: GNAT family protein [Actinomycetota bacterium]|nr:GNAT family protein [Actinomycetota bacterium]
MIGDVSDAHTPDVAFRERRADRLVIRRFCADDAASLAAYRSDPRIARYQSWDTPFSHAEARSFIDSLEATNPDSPGEWFQFAVVEAATGVHIGDVAAGIGADDPRLATIGVTLATSAQGQGYAREALAWLLDYLFLDRQKHRVSADCDARNNQVIALLEHLRMRREAHHLQSGWWKGEWVDEYVYALLAQEWLERRSPD